MISRFVVLAAAGTLVAFQPAGAQPTPAQPPLGLRHNAEGFDLGPETTAATVQAAVAALPEPLPAGPFQPSWSSLQTNYTTPAWLREAKFGLFMHWGLFSVPAFGGTRPAEWYQKHLYAGDPKTLAFHTERYGPPDSFGYKDFIPQFRAEHWDPAAWALLFRRAGARFVIPTAQHCDNWSNWDSRANPFNSVKMGPHRDLIGDLAKAVRAQGLRFGVSNHGMEAWDWVQPSPALAAELKAKHADVYDPQWAGFYLAADHSDAALHRFLVNWVQRNLELIDQYHPDILWFDNGIDHRAFDPLKQWIAAYYYNRAAQWGKAVAISAKKAAYAPSGDNVQTIGAILDFERIGVRSPGEIRTGAWLVDEPIGYHWGYAEGMKLLSTREIVTKLVDTVAKNGVFILNLSPKADGTIPEDQQSALLGVGQWLETNGEAIYGTHSWTDWSDARVSPAPGNPQIYYTAKGDVLYALCLGDRRPGATTVLQRLRSNGPNRGKVTSIRLLGSSRHLSFDQNEAGLRIRFPSNLARPVLGYVLKITGLPASPDPFTRDGNPLSP